MLHATSPPHSFVWHFSQSICRGSQINFREWRCSRIIVPIGKLRSFFSPLRSTGIIYHRRSGLLSVHQLDYWHDIVRFIGCALRQYRPTVAINSIITWEHCIRKQYVKNVFVIEPNSINESTEMKT